MEIVLNIAWVLCSLGLVWFWRRSNASNRVSLGTQILALAMVVLLLLPVISLSDDLMAAQGPTETDSCLRRVQHANEGHPSVVPATFALPEQIIAELAMSGFVQDAVQGYRPALHAPSLTRSLDSRPPPTA